MNLDMTAVLTAAKQINKARVSGKLSLVAVAKLNLLSYYIKFAKEQIDLGIEEYKDKYQLLVNKYNSLVWACPDIICKIDDTYTFIGSISNPYGPKSPTTVAPEPEPINEPPTIDDNSITVLPNVTTVLTSDLFLSKYNDPENDPMDAIRIDNIHTTNVGVFYVGGIPVVEEQIITIAQIDLEEFYHVGIDIDSAADSFDFSAREAHTGRWVN